MTTLNFKNKDNAISPIIASVLMIGVVIVCLSIVMVTLVGVTLESSEQPPIANFQASANSNYVYFTDGAMLSLSDLIFYNEDGTVLDVSVHDGTGGSWTGGTWLPGQYVSANDGTSNISAIVIHHNGHDYLIYKSSQYIVLPLGSMVPDKWEIPPKQIPGLDGYTIFSAVSWTRFKNHINEKTIDSDDGWEWAGNGNGNHSIFYDPSDRSFWVASGSKIIKNSTAQANPSLLVIEEGTDLSLSQNLVVINATANRLIKYGVDTTDTKFNSDVVDPAGTGHIREGTVYEYEDGRLYIALNGGVLTNTSITPSNFPDSWLQIGYNTSKPEANVPPFKVNQKITDGDGAYWSG